MQFGAEKLLLFKNIHTHTYICIYISAVVEEKCKRKEKGGERQEGRVMENGSAESGEDGN